MYFFFLFSGNIRSGLVFDGISKGDCSTKGNQSSSHSFGSRPPVRIPTNNSLSKTKQGVIVKRATEDKNETSGKENIINNQACGK